MSTSIPTTLFTPDGFRLRFIALFLGIFFLSTFAWSEARGTSMERLVIDQLTVSTSAKLINWVHPGEGVCAEGPRLISPRVRVSVLNGCEGTESILLLAAAVLAFPVSWRRKPAGLLLGAVGVFLLNQVRIVGLYFVLGHKPEWFAAVHGYIAPTVIILAGSLLFIFWLRWANKEESHVAQA